MNKNSIEPKIINNISITILQKSCPMYLLQIYFIFKLTEILLCFAASNQHFTGLLEYAKIMILNTLYVFYIYSRHNVHPFSIFYNISIFSCLSLCVSECVACKYSICIVKLQIVSLFTVIIKVVNNKSIIYQKVYCYYYSTFTKFQSTGHLMTHTDKTNSIIDLRTYFITRCMH